MAGMSIAVTVAGQLINHFRNFGRCFVSIRLHGLLEAGAAKLEAGEDGWKPLPFGGRSCVESRNIPSGRRHLRGCGDGYCHNQGTGDEALRFHGVSTSLAFGAA